MQFKYHIISYIFVLLILSCEFGTISHKDNLIYPKEVDFGIMQQGTRATKEIKIYNKGLVPINIDRIGVSCSCALLDRDKMQISPKSMVSFRVVLHMDTNKTVLSEMLTIKRLNPLRFTKIKIKARTN